MAETAKIAVMVNGIPGRMGIEVAREVIRRGWELVPFSLTGEEVAEERIAVGSEAVRLLKPSVREGVIGAVLERWPRLIAVDYTHPSAVNGNGEFYIRHKIPFVMGTTGGDRERLTDAVRNSGVWGVIAPNMAKQIVGFQAMIEWGAQEFPGLFAGWNLSVVESHQQGKADTSGTAKAVVASMEKMGLPGGVESIRMIREPDEQRFFGVPESALGGHAYHTYGIDSADGAVHFEFQHNVQGRRIYAEGSCDAVRFLAEKIEAGAPPRLCDMFDVLRSGAMGSTP